MSRTPDGIAEPIDDGEATALLEALSGQRLLLAVSGGPDSMAMLHLAAAVAGPLALTLHVATVDHGLRQEAAAECRLVEKACERLRLDWHILVWPGEKPKTRLQEAARDARYALLTRHAATLGIGHLLTAHTLDDQAETMLFRIARGSGIDGLSGMRRLSERNGLLLHRPLLSVPKTRLVATCRARDIAFASDPSNQDPRFARVRSRAILPLLAAEGLDATRFAMLAARAARATEALEQQAAMVRERVAVRIGEGIQLDGPSLAAEPAEILLRVVAAAIDDVRLSMIADDTSTDTARRAPRLDRLEALCAAMHRAILDRSVHVSTLAGCVIRVDRRGMVAIRRAPPRRFG